MKAYLVCNLGMSTGILQMKLEEEAKKIGKNVTVEAVPLGDVKEVVDLADVILLGPQIRFAYDEVKKVMPDKPVLLISPQDFGTMNAKNVLEEILKNVK